ncbi:MAG: hypothetical protein DWI21_01810 [Planctomycetota bacterium]|nr:MAG: hypothetical protein DWI21_01810 [Planctomycetota bacterium]
MPQIDAVHQLHHEVKQTIRLAGQLWKILSLGRKYKTDAVLACRSYKPSDSMPTRRAVEALLKSA